MKAKEWINADIIKPERANGYKALSIKVEVKTPLGDGVGYYNHIDKDWLVELHGDLSDELQAYTGVTYWKYINQLTNK